jgi:hypothetical protein
LESILNKNGFVTDEEIEQAKEMEKEQIENAYLRGIANYDPTFKSE